MARFRFNLRTLFVLATVAIVFFGYSQWRRQYIRRQMVELGRNGVGICYRPPPMFTAQLGVLPDDLRDKIWQRAPTNGDIMVLELSPDKFRIGSTDYDRPELYARLLELEKQVRGIGATEIHVVADGKVPYAPSDWVKEFQTMTTMRLLFCKNGNSTYEYVK